MSATLKSFAERLERDIRNRGLLPGHRYLTGEESARLLGTSVATANRALRILAENQVVVRQRSTGTIIGPAVATDRPALDLHTVSILVPASERSCRSFRTDPLIETLTAEMSDVADVRISYVPAEGDLEFVRSLIEETVGAGRLAGVVAVSCSFEVYQYLGDLGCPFVIGGSLYPGQSYPSVGTDERLAGKLLAAYLIEQGHRRLAFFTNSEFRPGDYHFHDGVSEALTEAGLPHNSMLLRAPGPSPAVLRAQVNELLEMCGPPTSFMVRVARWAEDVAEVVRARGMRVPQDVEIVYHDHDWSPAIKLQCTHVRPTLPHEEVMQLLGKMLVQVRSGAPLGEPSVMVPFELLRVAPPKQHGFKSK
jgi:DNA-binding LacI/PurR family transcriptional regulator